MVGVREGGGGARGARGVEVGGVGWMIASI